MNKRQLYKNIMRNVEKGLNEGFKTWRDENTPKFDEGKFKENVSQILDVLYQLLKEKLILSILTAYLNGSSPKVLINLTTDKNGATASEAILKNAHIVFQDPEFAAKMPSVFFYVGLNKNSDLMKYVLANKSVTYKKMENCEYIQCIENQLGTFLLIKVEDLMDDSSCKAVFDFFN